MSESMVERVARALYARRWGSHDGQDWPLEAENTRKMWCTDARAAIAAMRDPTDAMLRAGARGFQKAYSSDDSLADWRATWRAEIDAALSETE